MMKSIRAMTISLALTTAVVGSAVLAAPAAQAAQAQANNCANNAALLGCVWTGSGYEGSMMATSGNKVHGWLWFATLSATYNNSISSVVSMPGRTAYTQYFDGTGATGTYMFQLANGYMWESLPSQYNDKISSIAYSPSNL